MEFETIEDAVRVDGDEIYRMDEHSLDVVYHGSSSRPAYSICAGFMEIDLDESGRVLGFWGYLPLSVAKAIDIPEYHARRNSVSVTSEILNNLQPGVSKYIPNSEDWRAYYDKQRGLLMHLAPEYDPRQLGDISVFETVRGAWILLDGAHAVGAMAHIDPV